MNNPGSEITAVKIKNLTLHPGAQPGDLNYISAENFRYYTFLVTIFLQRNYFDDVYWVVIMNLWNACSDCPLEITKWVHNDWSQLQKKC